MAKRVQDLKPARKTDIRAWLKENIAEQKKRHAAICKEMNEDLAPQRAKWYQEFLQIVQTRGFNVSGDMRRKITKAEVPKKPRRPDQVVW